MKPPKGRNEADSEGGEERVEPQVGNVLCLFKDKSLGEAGVGG